MKSEDELDKSGGLLMTEDEVLKWLREYYKEMMADDGTVGQEVRRVQVGF